MLALSPPAAGKNTNRVGSLQMIAVNRHTSQIANSVTTLKTGIVPTENADQIIEPVAIDIVRPPEAAPQAVFISGAAKTQGVTINLTGGVKIR